MIQLDKWFEREFKAQLTPGTFPAVVERLRGTPARLEEQVAGLDHETLVGRIGEAWSIKTHIGHLSDLEPL